MNEKQVQRASRELVDSLPIDYRRTLLEQVLRSRKPRWQTGLNSLVFVWPRAMLRDYLRESIKKDEQP